MTLEHKKTAPKEAPKKLKKGFKTWRVADVNTPGEYEYVDARTEEEAIALSSYIDKQDLYATIKPEHNAFILDPKIGSYRTFLEDKDIADKIPNARIYDFEGTPLYYLVREYTDKGANLIAYTRPANVSVSPDVLYDARAWGKDLKKALKFKSTLALENLSTGVILGVLGLLILLLVILMNP